MLLAELKSRIRVHLRQAAVALGGLVMTGLILSLSACTTIGLTQPETFRERLAYAYGGVTAVRQTATDLLEARLIDEEEYINIEAQADVVREGLEIARTMAKSDLTLAEQRLSATVGALTALQSYLRNRQSPRPRPTFRIAPMQPAASAVI